MWNKILNIGVRSGLPFNEIKKIRVINGVNAIVFLISALYFILNSFVLNIPFHTVLRNLELLGITITLSGLLITHKGYYIFARLLFILFFIFLLTTYSLYTGGKGGVQYFLIATLVGCVTIFDKKRQYITLFALNIIALIVVVYHQTFYPPLLNFGDFDNTIFLIPNILLACLIVFFNLYLVKSDQEAYQAQIETQNEEITMQRDSILEAQKLLEKKNKHITESINYARRIQFAILPDAEEIKKYLPNSFIFYRPKDIVSGDFYWFKVQNEVLFLAAADCTGHGVPGAFMSLLGINSLNQALLTVENPTPMNILYELDRLIQMQLKQNTQTTSLRDGMDISLCMLKDGFLYFSSAQHTLLHFRAGTMYEYKGDKNPIGSGAYQEKVFTEHVIKIEKGDRFYMYSDGITDQFDATNNQKFTSKRFKSLITAIHNQDFDNQESYLEHQLNDWKGDTKQTDDILVVGFEGVGKLSK